jgi:hypothetical protein
MKAEKDGRTVKITAIVNHPTYYTRYEQDSYQRQMENNLHSALRGQGFSCQQIQFTK